MPRPIASLRSSKTQRRSLRGAAATVNARRAIRVEESVVVERPASELFAYWSQFEKLPCFIDHLESVERTDETHSRWTVRGPAHLTAVWDAELVNVIPDELIAWKTIGEPPVRHAGSVHFSPIEPSRTKVRLVVEAEARGGPFGRSVMKLLGGSGVHQLSADLGRFKDLMEHGGPRG